MATYEVRIRDAEGKYRTVREDAATPREARMALQLQGVQVLEVKEAKKFTLQSDLDLSFLAKITVKDRAIFARQFAALVNAGVALVRGIGVLADQCTNPKLKKILMAVNNDIQQGSTLADAMRPHPEAFDNLFVAMIQAGETGGGSRRSAQPSVKVTRGSSSPQQPD
ncbi:pilC [Thermosynechococcus vestitus BP-1]|uniref:PilC protein n=1 Tax=Thermosynechococcus vestitus (strain NIES-2133 / IAM M-273 / BP-1) TaxID=197221 RepID=Q8DMJ6_THEVB|nr:type II secretion system F family protein [Thermosynechococcus vestitus]BAC07673.1 pilC [Thermosynechococcus vestitus BP-1]